MKLSFRISKDIVSVMDCLTNPERFVSVHPLIYKMEPLGDGSYKVYERIKIGILPYAFTYNATITKDEQQNEVLILANVKRLVKIKMHFKLQDLGNYTQIEEVIEIFALLPVKRLMFRLLNTQHQILINNIENSN